MIKKIPPAAIALAASLALAAGHARAQSSTFVSTNDGTDLYLGFQESGDSDLIADIGSYTQFVNAVAPFTIQFGVIPTGQTGAGTAVYSLLADLNNNFTSSWTSSTTLKWGVIGDDENDSPNLLFVTQDGSSSSKAPNNPGSQQTAQIQDKIETFDTYLGDDFSTVHSSETASVTSASANSWTSFTPGGPSAFDTGLNIEQGPGDGPLSTLNLYAANNTGSGTATDLGTLSLATNGEITFTPESVPEPSSWLSILGGALFLGLFRLRRNVRPS